MNKSITQDNQNDKQISTSIRRFFTRFHVSSALKAANAYKKEESSCNGNFPVPVSADFFKQKHVYESHFRSKHTCFCQRHRISFHEDDSDQLDSLYNDSC